MHDTVCRLPRMPLPGTSVNKGMKKGRSPDMEPPPFARTAHGEPYLRTVNFQFLGWLSLLGVWSWSSRLPAKSCASVVTVAL
jgi:hypothetical protein